ncbi:MAG: hypothetical protein F4Y49_08770 [Dehalococcoidia bacterium]|nr:hypothetical protein [Dehalococcoidia bacterium]
MTSNMTKSADLRSSRLSSKRDPGEDARVFFCHIEDDDQNREDTFSKLGLQHFGTDVDAAVQINNQRLNRAGWSAVFSKGTCKYPAWSRKTTAISTGANEVFGPTDSSTPYFDTESVGLEDFGIGICSPGMMFDAGLETAISVAASMSHEPSPSNYIIAPTGWIRADSIETLIDVSSHSTPPKSVLSELKESHPSFANRIEHLQTLESDWDGYDSAPITDKAAEKTAIILKIVKRISENLEDPFIAPLPSGGLQIEWEVDSGNECLLVIPPNGINVEYLLETPTISGDDFDASEGYLTFRNSGFRNLLNQLTA